MNLNELKENLNTKKEGVYVMLAEDFNIYSKASDLFHAGKKEEATDYIKDKAEQFANKLKGYGITVDSIEHKIEDGGPSSYVKVNMLNKPIRFGSTHKGMSHFLHTIHIYSDEGADKIAELLRDIHSKGMKNEKV